MLIPNITSQDVINISKSFKLISAEEFLSSESYTLYCGEEITEDMLHVNEFEEVGLMENDPLNVILLEVEDEGETVFISALYQVTNNNTALVYSLVKQSEDMELLDVVGVY